MHFSLSNGIAGLLLFSAAAVRAVTFIAAIAGGLAAIIFCLLPSAFCLAALAVTFEWDASPDAWVTNYAILYGTQNGNYTERMDVGTNTTCTITNTDLPAGPRIYFVVVCHGDDGTNGPAESLPSNQVSLRVGNAKVFGDTTNNNGVVAGQVYQTNLTVRGTAQVRTP